MHTSLSKKLLAGLLSLVMVLSLVAPSTSAQAATKYSLTDKKSVKSGYTFKYELKGVSKGCYVKVTRNVSGEKVVYNKKELTKTTKVNGTGKTLNLYVTYGEKDENYTGKFTVRVYGKKTNKLYKTLVETVTVKVPEKEEPEEPVEEEAALVSLEATGSKELTATLSKEVAGLTEKDFTVKKGTVKVTPASVTVEGTKVVITLGTKITEGTYSVAYKESTVEVKTEDEKVVSLTTVGTSLAQTANGNVTTVTPNALDGDNTTVNAEIAYQALNQYGDPMNATVISVTSTFGGAVNYTQPTAKKPGIISIVNIPAAIGVVGNAGKVIIVCKEDGVSTTNEVTFSEEAKVAKVEVVGIYNTALGAYVDSIDAQASVENYKVVIKAYNQYEQEIPFKQYAAKMYQTISEAKVLTNVGVDGISGNKLTADSFTELSIDDVDEVALNLITTTSSVTGTKKTDAGSLQLIIVGDRFGTVLNTTLSIKQIDLIKSFAINANDAIYANDRNELEYTAISVAGEEVKKYETLKKLVNFNTTDLTWEKQTDGTAKLIYTPSSTTGVGLTPSITAFNTTNDNRKETTIASIVANCNSGISTSDTIVVTNTMTVFEDRIAVGIVKYTGDVASSTNTVTLKASKFVFEDQYGNIMKSTDTNYSNIKLDYKYGDAAIVDNEALATSKNFYVTSKATKLYVTVAGESDTTGAFDITKAQLVLSLSMVDTSKTTNLKATWYGDGDQWYVAPDRATSGISKDLFKLTGTVNGKKVTLDSSQYSIKTDTYETIPSSEYLTAVKEATVTFTVLLKDADGEEYTEEVSTTYTYSAAPSKVWAIYAVKADLYGEDAEIKTGVITAKTITTNELADLFLVVDQYGEPFSNSTLTYEVSLGSGTDNWVVKKNNTKTASIDLTATGAVSAGAEFDVIATLPNGKTAAQHVVSLGEAASQVAHAATDVNEKVAAAKTASESVDTKAEYDAFKSALETANNVYNLFIMDGGSDKDLAATTKQDLVNARTAFAAAGKTLIVSIETEIDDLNVEKDDSDLDTFDKLKATFATKLVAKLANGSFVEVTPSYADEDTYDVTTAASYTITVSESAPVGYTLATDATGKGQTFEVIVNAAP